MDHRDNDASSSAYQLILPDLSGIAKIVDDYSLPTFDSSLREIVAAHDEHNRLIQRLLAQMMEEHENLSKQVKLLTIKLNQLSELKGKEEDIIEAPLPVSEPAEPTEIYDASEGLADAGETSEAPGIYYTVNPRCGERSIEGEGRVVIKGKHVKLDGKLTVLTNEDSVLYFDSLAEYQAIKVESCLIKFGEKTIENIEVDDLNRGQVDLKFGEIDSSFFPCELTYRIKYLTKKK